MIVTKCSNMRAAVGEPHRSEQRVKSASWPQDPMQFPEQAGNVWHMLEHRNAVHEIEGRISERKRSAVSDSKRHGQPRLGRGSSDGCPADRLLVVNVIRQVDCCNPRETEM